MYLRLIKLVLLAILFLGGCSTTGQLSSLPPVSDITTAPTLTVIRESRFTGSGVSFRVDLDEQHIAMLENGSHIVFKVQPGIHSISFSNWQLGFGWTVWERIEFDCMINEQYYIKFSPGLLGGTLSHISYEEAAILISETKYLPLDQ